MPEHEYYLKTKWKWFYAGLGALSLAPFILFLYISIDWTGSVFNIVALILYLSAIGFYIYAFIYRPVFKPQVTLTVDEIILPRYYGSYYSSITSWLNYKDIKNVTEGKTFGVGYRRYSSKSRKASKLCSIYPTKGLSIYETIENAQECYDIIASKMKEHKA